MLAINTNKSIYLPGEDAYLQMAALTDMGNTICDAPLQLEITAPGTEPRTSPSTASAVQESALTTGNMPTPDGASTSVNTLMPDDPLAPESGLAKLTTSTPTATSFLDSIATFSGTTTPESALTPTSTATSSATLGINSESTSTPTPTTDNTTKSETLIPTGTTTVFRTDNGLIVNVSGKCKENNLTDVPDYFAHYVVQEPGTYAMKLTNLDNGYSITDSFNVENEVPFVVERVGPTRINPKYPYAMKFTVTARENFTGKIIETVPTNWEINPPGFSRGTQEGAGIKDVGSPQVELNGSGTEAYITWDANLFAGQSVTFDYAFDAPDVSPEFYLLGPLAFTETSFADSLREIFGRTTAPKFEEARRWQIASDAPNMKIRQELNILDGVLSAIATSSLPATFNNASTSITAEQSNVRGVAFKSDGTKMYIAGLLGPIVHEYDLSSAWSVPTAVFNNASTSVTTQDSLPEGVAFKSDGTKMYIAGGTTNKIFE